MKCSLIFCCFMGLLCVTAGWPVHGTSGHPYCGRNPFLARRYWVYFRYPWGYYRYPWGFFSKPWGSKTNDCADPSISLDEKMRLNAGYNDVNNDGVVRASEVVYDVDTYFDANDDGTWTESECVKRWMCAYGDTTLVATYICTFLFRGEANITLDAISQLPDLLAGIPTDTFVGRIRERYELFRPNECTNKCLTVEEKLTRNALNNDYNRDGLVTLDDFAYGLTNSYDEDKNGEVTKAEFVNQWVCFYGDSGDYARYIWDTVIAPGAASVDIATINFGPAYDAGVPISDFINTNRQYYDNFNRNNPQRDCIDSTMQWRARFNF